MQNNPIKTVKKEWIRKIIRNQIIRKIKYNNVDINK